VPHLVRHRLISAYITAAKGCNLYEYNPNRVRDLQRARGLIAVLGATQYRTSIQTTLVTAYRAAGMLNEAVEVAKDLLLDARTHGKNDLECTICEELSWINRLSGRTDWSLSLVNARLLVKPGVHRQPFLLVERARIHIAMQHWDEADQDLKEFFRVAPAGHPLFCRYFAAACLIEGSLRERCGDATGAIEAWRKGLRGPPAAGGAPTTWLERVEGPRAAGRLLILGSLSGELSDALVADLITRAVVRIPADSPIAAVKTLRLPPAVRAALRGMWRTPRGRHYARRIAFLDLSFAELLRIPPQLFIAELFGQGAFGGKLTPQHDDLVWKLAEDFYAALVHTGKMTTKQVLPLLMTWKGVTNFLGWGAVRGALEPQIRGPLAYVAGHRYLRLKKRKEAVGFFRTALADAPPDSALRRLAQAELERLGEK